jgi:tRNA threonylcarbamoyl adenosine modification protein YjeE
MVAAVASLDDAQEDGGTARWSLDLADESATVALARFIAGEVRSGDLITLSGDLGAGKTTFARSLIRVLAADPWLEIPSPTFTLMQVYDTSFGRIVHADLYRINGPDELAELGWDEAAEDALVIVEWPERARNVLAADRLDITFQLPPDASEGRRIASLRGYGNWRQRLGIAKAVRGALAGAGWQDATRNHIQGDASTRAYERLTTTAGETAILMIAPRRPDGPPVRRGKPYSAIARLAESVEPFVAVANGLRALGFSAPEIFAADLDAGILLLEDFGTEPIVDVFGPMPDRYAEAVAALAVLHAMEPARILPIAPGRDHKMPAYDIEALLIEAELLLDWYAPHQARVALPAVARASFTAAWTDVLAEVVAGSNTWTLRDYHSPNLLWLQGREGIKRVGILDFQDAVIGHPAYDTVSLLQDARVTVYPELELKLLGTYAAARRQASGDFDFGAFARAYSILGAQRATKLLGIFTRLHKRDHKPQYLRHLSRIEAYLARNLTHPVLSPLKVWYETHLPRVLAGPQS